MSIRYLTVENTPVLFASLEKLFDPRYNNHFPPSRVSGVHPTKIRDLLNTLYCRENLEDYNNFKYLMFDGRNPSEREHQHFLYLSTAVPSEQHWVFHMLRRRRGVIISDEPYQLLVPHISTITFHSNIVVFDPTNKILETPTPQEFVTFINAAHTNWHDKLFSAAGATTIWTMDYIFGANSLVSLLISFTCGNKYAVLSPTDNYITPSQANMILTTDSTARLELDLMGRDIKVRVHQPISLSNRTPLYSVMNYSVNVLRVLPYPNKEPKEKDPVLVGVELEVSTDYSIRDLVDAAKDPFFIGKQDSSISGSKSNRIELVTAPSSFKYLKRAYAQWLNNLDYTEFDTTTTTNNGMHVHVGREHFEDNTHIRNFCWFFNNPANSDFLIYISERGNYEAMMRYSPFYQFPNGTTRTKAFRQVYHFLGSGFRGITNFKGGWESAKTVEVRMFRGVVSYASIVKNLEFVEAIFHFTKGLTSYRQLTLSGFLSWLQETNANKYILLKKFIDMGDVKKMTVAADVKDVLFNETNEERIIQLLQHSSLKITNEHISVLNRGKKRTFQLNKETGEISIIYHNRSKLQPLDKSFAQRYLR